MGCGRGRTQVCDGPMARSHGANLVEVSHRYSGRHGRSREAMCSASKKASTLAGTPPVLAFEVASTLDHHSAHSSVARSTMANAASAAQLEQP